MYFFQHFNKYEKVETFLKVSVLSLKNVKKRFILYFNLSDYRVCSFQFDVLRSSKNIIEC